MIDKNKLKNVYFRTFENAQKIWKKFSKTSGHLVIFLLFFSNDFQTLYDHNFIAANHSILHKFKTFI